jgi:hypothetical protein
MTLLADLQYFSPVVYYNELNSYSHCILEQYEDYRKTSFRNRCTLLGANGPITLSIPLTGGRNQKKISREVAIENKERWQERHWKTIESCYNRSPWFEYHRDDLRPLYLKKYDFLVDWNLDCLRWVCAKMSIATSLELSISLVTKPSDGSFSDQRNRWLPSTVSKLSPAPEPYPQVFGERFGFVPNLSILDKLFCDGSTI